MGQRQVGPPGARDVQDGHGRPRFTSPNGIWGSRVGLLDEFLFWGRGGSLHYVFIAGDPKGGKVLATYGSCLSFVRYLRLADTTTESGTSERTRTYGNKAGVPGLTVF